MRAYINAKIWKSEDTAFLVDGNTIVQTGKDQEIEEAAGKGEIIDLNGMFVTPGFTDSHMHLASLGSLLDSLRLDAVTDYEGLKKAVQKYAASLENGQWVIGRGYHESRFTDGMVLNRQLLDEICSSHPVMLKRTCGHVAVINSKAIEEAGIDENTEIESGRIRLEEGILEEYAIDYVSEKLPVPSEKEMIHAVEKGAAYCNAHGITAVGSDDLLSLSSDYRDMLNVLEKLSYQDRLTVRINEQCRFGDPKQFASFLDDGYTMDVGNEFFKIGPLKLITDGSLGGRTAAMRMPYTDEPENKGVMTMDEEEIETFVQLAHRFNMPVIAHAIGDEAVEVMLDIFKENTYEGNPLHDGLVHCQIMSKAQMRRIIAMNLACYIQPQFIDADAEILESRVGKSRAKASYPFKSLYEGTLTSGGSDAPVEMCDPLAGIQFAVTRKSVSFDAEMNQEECMDVDQAIALFCEKGYETMFMNDEYGKIAPGYKADFTVIDQDIREMKPEEISKAKIMMTVSDGRTVFER